MGCGCNGLYWTVPDEHRTPWMMMVMLCVFMSLLWLPCTSSFVMHSSSRFSLSLIPCPVFHKGAIVVSSFQLQEGVRLQFDVEGLESRSRAELQQLAKEHGLKANARSVDIIDRLKAIHASSSSTDDEDDDDDDRTVMRSEVSSAYQSGNMGSNTEHDDVLPQDNQSNDPSKEVDDRISRVLASQGLSWSDILQLQHQFYEDPDGIASKDELSAAEDDTEVDTDIATEFYSDDDRDKNHHDEVNKGNRKTRVVHSPPTDRFANRSKLVVKPIVDNASSSRKRPSNDRTPHLEIGATSSIMKSNLEQPLRSGVDVSDITTRSGTQHTSASLDGTATPRQQILSTRSLSSEFASFSSAVVGPNSRIRSNSRVQVSTVGITLQAMLSYLVERHGFDGLYKMTNLRCFANRPSLGSSLKAMRQDSMEWARRKVEYLYIEELKKDHSKTKSKG